MVVEARWERGGVTYEIKYHLLSEQGQGKPYLEAGDRVQVLWQDERKLAEIRRANREGGAEAVIPLLVIPKGKGIIPLRKIVEGGE